MAFDIKKISGASVGDALKGGAGAVTTDIRRKRLTDKINDWIDFNENSDTYIYRWNTGSHKKGTYKENEIQGWGRRHKLSVASGGKRYITIGVGKGYLNFGKGDAIILDDTSWKAEKATLEYIKGCIENKDFDGQIDSLSAEAGKYLRK
jgi:hypothetical protein